MMRSKFWKRSLGVPCKDMHGSRHADEARGELVVGDPVERENMTRFGGPFDFIDEGVIPGQLVCFFVTGDLLAWFSGWVPYRGRRKVWRDPKDRYQ